jgi:hypothetical protein
VTTTYAVGDKVWVYEACHDRWYKAEVVRVPERSDVTGVKILPFNDTDDPDDTNYGWYSWLPPERIRKESGMPDDQKKKPAPGPLVEDTQTVGGTDKATGAPVIRPKTADGKADKVTEATDPNERS